MAAVTQTISTYLGGVSRQIDSKKKLGQVRECTNTLPDPTFGLRKRPGTEFIKTLTTSALTNAKWFYIHRDGDEQYIGRISTGSPGNIEIWNATTGAVCEVTYPTASHQNYLQPRATVADKPNNNYDVLTVQDTTFITNKTTYVTAAAIDSPYVSDTEGTIRLLNVRYGSRYQVKINDQTTADHVTVMEDATGATEVLSSQDVITALKNNIEALTLPGTLYVTEITSSLELKYVVPALSSTILANGTSNGTEALGDNRLINLATTVTKSLIDTTTNVSAADTDRVEGTYTIDSEKYTTSGNGTDAEFSIVIDSAGAATVTVPKKGKTFTVGETITVSNQHLGQTTEPGGGWADLTFDVATIYAGQTGLTVDVEIDSNGVASSIVLNTAGKNYSAGDEVNIDKSQIPGTSSGTITDDLKILVSSLDPTTFTCEAIDDAGNNNLVAFQQQVNNVTDLPDEAKHNRLVKILNTAKDEKSAYWAKFIAENGESGRGYWEETVDPKVSKGLNNSTMPHELENWEPNKFKFKEIDWKERIVGDDKTNEHPSFVNADDPRTIQQTFLYNSRLGFLTKDNVSISRAQDYYNFYFTSALTLTADDPIDLSCSSIRPAVLHGVIPTAQGLSLFSKNQQFMMFADDGILTPDTAIIRSISNYEMDTNIDPVDIGTNINFVSKTPSHSRLFGMQTRGLEQTPIIQDISRAVSEWIPQEIDNLFSSPQNSLTGVYSSNDKFIYMYRIYTLGEEQVMQAWFKWELPGKVQFCYVDNDVMWIVIENGTNYTLLKANISKSTTDSVITTSDGQQVNPHMDMFTPATNGAAGSNEKTVVYDATDNLSKCYIPYTDLTQLTPVILIKGTGVTESGFTINPTRDSDVDGTYFIIPRKNFESEAANVYVGYQYNYDVELPKTYFRKNDQTADYTASLTVARMKFAVGLSSVVSFKVKSKGFRGEIAEFTGTGTDGTDGTDYFVVPFELKVENGIVVKVNGVKQDSTNYIVSKNVDSSGNILEGQYRVTFVSGHIPRGAIPASASTGWVATPAEKIEITTDTWYDVQPVQEAGQYLADDVPLLEEKVFTVPIHQRSENFNLRVFSNSPFPVSLNSMMWEGNYSPRFYRRK